MSTVDSYKKHTHREHILELPDTYIGSTELHQEMQWVYNAATGKMVNRQVAINPGFYKLFDEILVNARDAVVRGGVLPVKNINIEVTSTADGPRITVENDGDGITVAEHPEHKIPIPEMIFGHLLTSSNYNKNEEKIVGGKNGYGSKCTGPETNILLWNSRTKMAKDISVGDELIGDDGMPRKVLNVMTGKGPMYEVSQAHGDSYKVNDEHIITMHMPDHKVIFWNTSKNGWSVLWWNNEERVINAKTFAVSIPTKICPECGLELSSNLARHYSRVHKDKEIPKTARKSPTINPEDNEEVRAARLEAEEFCKSIPDDNVFDINIKDYIALNDTTKKRLAGVRGECVQWEKKEVALDPYVLGLWLGDGSQTGYVYTCYGEKDPQIIEYLEKWCSENDASIKKTGKYSYYFASVSQFKKKNCHPIRTRLDKYNLLEEKHIPLDYIMNDRDTRLKVLAGIIDTDGTVARDGSRVSITQGVNHTRLIHDIVYLARSLGFATHVNKHPTSWTHKGEKKTGEAYKINISGRNIGDIPTLLPRKKCASTVARNTSKSTGFIEVRDIGEGDYVGIKIDGNERFLINDFTVTHNCTNIFSKEFTIDIKSHAEGKRYRQTWKDNMSVCGKPVIRKTDSGASGYVRIEFVPDINRFPGVSDDKKSLTADMEAVLHTRAVELSAMLGGAVKVTWNKKAIAVSTFDKFVKLFLRDGGQMSYEQCGPRWDIAVVPLSHLETIPDDKHVSFVNGIRTKKGGKHVEYVQQKVLTDFCDGPAKKKKMDIKPAQLKESVVFFVGATIVNPSFDSQTKEYLSTTASKFGSTPKWSTKLIDGLVKTGLLDEAQAILDAKLTKDAKKTDGKKRSTLRGMAKLEDALWAGTAKSGECTLILTEGDSAATSAISGLQVVGREKWGVFPLRGKILNIKDISLVKVNANEEFTSIKRILGLEHGKVYNDTKALRYGRVMVMADQDHDGSHIKGLLMNIFHTEWPSLLKLGFICSILTPILKVHKGQQSLSFYSQGAYETWRNGLPAGSERGWETKYYKGLGTSTPQEAREWFEKMNEVKYEWDDNADNSILLAFSKSRADDRKTWLGTYDPHRVLNTDSGAVKLSSFINDELIHFSNADNLRSLPHLMDGLKPSQRKILYCCLKRNLTKEIKVAQLAGYVSEHAAYHHGEVSLASTIVGMAQNFIGSNNVNMLQPIGQFGCLSPDTEILMWNGEIKPANEVVVGDVLVGDDGLQRIVLRTTSGIDTMYEINDMQNKKMTVNSQHILTLQYNDNFKIKYKNHGKLWYFNYFDGNTIKQCGISTNEPSDKKRHLNASSITKEDGYNRIVEKCEEIKKQCENTSSIIDIKIEDYIKLSEFNKRGIYMVSNLNCVEWDKQDVPIDPYILGAWLGDGDHMGKGFTSCDSEVIKSFVSWLKTIGAEVSHHKSANHDGYHYLIRRKNSGQLPAVGSKENKKESCIGCISSNVEIKHDTCDWICEEEDIIVNTELYEKSIKLRLNPFTQILRDNNLYTNKHIPINYMINDKETRLQLLAGFIDTDGTIKENNTETTFIEISQSKRLHANLIKSLEFIAKSLGYATSIYYSRPTKTTMKGEDASIMTLRIMGNNIDEIPTRIPRKKIQFSGERTSKTMHFTSFNVECIGKGPFCGWSIDGNERFLLGNFVVTHNSRLQGGDDSAASRYIHTALENIVSTLVSKADDPLLKIQDDDGMPIEPAYYAPTVPILAINGALGIGTGFSTYIPPHNPKDIVSLLRARLNGSVTTLANRPLDPWWYGFRGKVVRTDENTWVTYGNFELDEAKNTVTITELPIGVWTKEYKEALDKMCVTDEAVKVSGLKNFDDLYNDVDVKFVLYLTEDAFDMARDTPYQFIKKFGLSSSWKTTNMVAFDNAMNIVKYKTIGDMMESFYLERIDLYEKRRLSQLAELEKERVEVDAKKRFLTAVIEDRMTLIKQSDAAIVEQMKRENLPPLSDPEKADLTDGYEYLLRLRIDRVKESAIKDMEKTLMSLLVKIEELRLKTANILWEEDLAAFETAWEKMIVAREAAKDGKPVPNKVKIVRKK